MKKHVFLVLFSLNTIILFCQTNHQLELLNKFINTHNSGTDEAISTFIKSTYHPSLQDKLNLKEHIKFYKHIVTEFGPLNSRIYEVVETKPTKLIVNLIKTDRRITDRSINPTEILVVEIDTHPKQPQYLSRGLGLGALACTRRKNE
ncbi:hypothetical protein [Winogradskyella sp.]|uniref:hypothetical protein n=1 Tax=Winogradskyella sp. TaxID=1883156 RepID=UPI00262F27DA|nr:hypothetical protein [Winogradskyella sp.]